VRRQLRGVDRDPAAHRVDLLGQPVDRLDQSGDVGRARQRQHCDPAGVLGEQVVEGILVQRAVWLGGHPDGPGPCPPRQVVRGCSSIVVSTTEPAGIRIERARWFTASVVFLPSTTTSRSGSAPTKVIRFSRAPSYAAVLRGDM
jgi:hypothetical protein